MSDRRTQSRGRKCLAAVVLAGWAMCWPLAAQMNWFGTLPAGPYSTADGVGSANAPDEPIPGFVGPQGNGVSNFDSGGNATDNGQVVNPNFVGWATSIVNYAPANPQTIDLNWLPNSGINGNAPLGPATGNVYDVVSLGDLGSADIGNEPLGTITLQFAGGIADGPGPDFAVFGNAFVLNGSSLVYAKVAYVEVSSDGVNFARFPLVDANPQPATEPQYGYPSTWPYATSDPTLMYNIAGKHQNANGYSWGTPFDLAQLANHPYVLNGTVDLNSIQYVRITEIPGSGDFLDDEDNPIYAAWVAIGSPGFELQAVGVLYDSAFVAGNLTAVAPAITSQPANATVQTGRTAVFSIGASGEPPPSYHWMHRAAGASTWSYLTDGSTYTGSATDQLSVNRTTQAMTGDAFACEAINSAGSVSSMAASLTVNPAPPTILNQASSASVMVGQAASFTFTALGATAWQWQVSSDGGQTWSNVTNGATTTGATATTLNLSGLTTNPSGQLYRCVASNASGAVTSNAVTLTVQAPITFPKQPAGQAVKVGATVTLNGLAAGNGVVHYQWQFNGGNISKATSANLTLKAVKATAEGNYTLVASIAGVGAYASNPARLLVITAPKITVQPPTTLSVQTGGSANFSIVASIDPEATTSYTWQKGTANLTNGNGISGANTNMLQIANATTAMAGSYKVVVANLAGTAASRAVKLVVTAPKIVPPKITQQPPASVNAGVGGEAMFSVTATGDPSESLTYAWEKGTVKLADGNGVAGASTNTLQLTNLTKTMAGSYKVVVSNTAGKATSAAVKLVIK